MTTTRAAVLRAPDKPYVIEDVVLGELRPDEVLVRIVGTGMCHTDLLPRNPAMGMSIEPVILGHEGSGIVESIGAAVTRVGPGDHVLISFDSCGGCPSCLGGAPAYCPEFRPRNLTSRRVDGSASASSPDGAVIGNRWFAQSSFAGHAVATERNLVVVDADLPLELLGPLGCGIQTGAGAVLNEMRLAPGQSIAVFGTGAVGLAAVMAARLAGAGDIVAVDVKESRLEMARELGATRLVHGGPDVSGADVAAQIAAGGRRVDFTFDTTAVTDVMATAVTVLACPGKAVLVGVGTGKLEIAPTALAGRTVTFVIEGSAVPQLFLPHLIEFWKQGRFPFERLIRSYPLSEINAAEADSLSGATIKPVLVPG
jgi:aryl-alcohol dehydrogenase